MSAITPRLLTKTQAAEYCGLSPVTFGSVCPVTPIVLGEGVRMHRYDVREIDAWIDSHKAPAKADRESIWDMIQRLTKPSELEDKYLKILKFMRDHPECDTSADIKGAGTHA